MEVGLRVGLESGWTLAWTLIELVCRGLIPNWPVSYVTDRCHVTKIAFGGTFSTTDRNLKKRI
jgi:hypothetical protein